MLVLALASPLVPRQRVLLLEPELPEQALLQPVLRRVQVPVVRGRFSRRRFHRPRSIPTAT
jgi:hypothetical protein